MTDDAMQFGAVAPGENHIELATGVYPNGVYLDLAAPDPADISLEAIAHGLSHTCRFAGQTRRFYSVAEHAVLVADRLAATGHDVLTQLTGLHHDDSEAFIGDVTRPLKALLPGYAKLEYQVGVAIHEALSLPLITVEQQQAVKDADDWALACEAFYLLPSRGRTWFCWGLYDHEDPGVEWAPHLGSTAQVARELYLERHQQLTERRRAA